MACTGLPAHVTSSESQQELESDDESTTFSYDVKLTYDFLQLIMQQGGGAVLYQDVFRVLVAHCGNTSGKGEWGSDGDFAGHEFGKQAIAGFG